MTNLNLNFTALATPQGEAQVFDSGLNFNFWQAPKDSVFDVLSQAVADLRQYWAERGMHPCIAAARAGVHATVEYILKGGRFANGRDIDGLDAGYYIARSCTPYDFTAMGAVAWMGSVAQVAPLRFYNQNPDGRAALISALDAGLTFTDCADEEGHNAGFYIARSGDAELIARYEQAGGTFRAPELRFLGRTEELRKTA